MDGELTDKYAGNLLPFRTSNYPARFIPYIAILALAKFFRSFGIFLSYDILKLIHVIPFLFLIKAGSAVCFVLIQKPFTGRKISKRLWLRVGRHALLGCVIQLLWLYGLTLCGPLRTLLLFEHSDMVVIAATNALFTSSSSPSKFRGALMFLLAFLSIMLFDHDLDKVPAQGPTNQHESVISHVVNHLTGLTGLSDHKAGVVLLFITLCLTVGYNMASKNLSLDIGGAKRLHALSAFFSAILLAPWAGFITYTIDSKIESWMSAMFPVAVVTLLVMVGNYYIEAVCVSRLDISRTSRLGSVFVLASALFLAAVWNHPFIGHITNTQSLKDVLIDEHEISAGVIFSIGSFALATYVLLKPLKSSKGNFVGYSAAGPPLYNFAGEALQRTSQSVIVMLKNGLRQILEESDSRSIFVFLCINLSFTFVELIYGAWTNSLGLISDGFHMFFDCSALVMGLYAAVMSHWKPTRIFSYGYDRVEILSGFINALFLIVIAFFVFVAAVARLFDPPDIITDRLLIVSVAGFVVNLIGIFSFHHGHSHGSSGGGGGSSGHSHSGSVGHGHSHGSASAGHGHSHAKGQSCGSSSGHAHNTNLEGVFLHILADTLGSVGVIISTLLIENFGWKIADPLCSVFISVMIFISVLPLLKETTLILLQRTPVDIQQTLATVFHKVLSLEGVASYSEEHFWRHSSKVVCGTIHIQIEPEASELKIVSQVTALFREAGVTNLCVQVEKRSYFQHLSGLGVSSDRISAMTRVFRTIKQTEDFTVGRS